ncbi:MAG: hypothetical protein ACOCWR_04725 [Oceanidesulfovibrio sp.]
MVHVKGWEWAGKKIVLEPWQCFILAVAFGWGRKASCEAASAGLSG